MTQLEIILYFSIILSNNLNLNIILIDFLTEIYIFDIENDELDMSK